MRIITVLVLCLVLASCDTSKKEIESVVKLYEQALEQSDATTAKVALSQLLILEPDSLRYKDSLARLFIRQGNYEGGTKLAQELHDIGKADLDLLELLGAAYQQLQDVESSDAIFTELFAKSKDYNYEFQRAASFMSNTIMFDSLTNQVLEQIKVDTLASGAFIELPAGNNTNQQVPLESAMYYLIARQAIDVLRDPRKAEEYYVKAIQGFDSFELARYELSELYAAMQGQRR